MRTTRARHRLGISLLETVLSLLILSGAFVAALNTIGGARVSQGIAAERRLGLVLAEDLMAEVLSHGYKEEGATLLGIDLGERGDDRSTFDDIDDYDGWRSSPPVGSDGVKIDGADGYTRQVAVKYVQLMNPPTTSLTDQGMKQVVVTVYNGDKEVAELITYRSDVYSATGGN